MSSESSKEGVNGLRLRDRSQINIAWQAVSITGGAPNAEPFLDAMIELMAPESAPIERKTSAVFVGGDHGKLIKREIIHSLQVVTENLDDKSETSTAAKGLLKLLLEE